MASLTVTPDGPSSWRVDVADDDGRTTSHLVRVPADLMADLGLDAHREEAPPAQAPGRPFPRRDGPGEDPERAQESLLRNDRKRVLCRLPEVRTQVRPVVVLGHLCPAVDRLELVPVHVADRLVRTQGDGPLDCTVRHESGEDDVELVFAHREVTERVAVHVYVEPVADLGRGLALRPHEHAAGVDLDVPIGAAKDLEDLRRVGGDVAGDLDSRSLIVISSSCGCGCAASQTFGSDP